MSERPFDDLRRRDDVGPEHGLDLTPQIMRRLGIPEAGSTAARRRRLQRLAARTAMVLVAITGVVVGLSMYVDAGTARTRSGPTIPSALRHDLESNRHVISGTINALGAMRPQLSGLLSPSPVVIPESTMSPEATVPAGNLATPRRDELEPDGKATSGDAV